MNKTSQIPTTTGVTASAEDVDAVLERLSWHDDDVVFKATRIVGRVLELLSGTEGGTATRAEAAATRSDAIKKLLRAKAIVVLMPFLSSDEIMFSIKNT